MIKQLLNSVIAKYRDLSVTRRSIICLSLRLWQIIYLLATDKSRYFAQPRPITANDCDVIVSELELQFQNGRDTFTKDKKYSGILRTGSDVIWYTT